MTTPDTGAPLSALTLEQWRALRVFQDYHQLLLTLLSEPPRGEPARVELKERDKGTREVLMWTQGALRDAALEALPPPSRQLLALTFDETLSQILDAEWAFRAQGGLGVKPELLRRAQGVVSGVEPRRGAAPAAPSATAAPARRPKGSSLDILNPLEHISQEDDTHLTSRNLEQVVSALDGITLLLGDLRQLVLVGARPYFMSLVEAMERAALIRRDGDYVRLDVTGARISRLGRAERQSALGVIAERLRRDEQRLARAARAEVGAAAGVALSSVEGGEDSVEGGEG